MVLGQHEKGAVDSKKLGVQWEGGEEGEGGQGAGGGAMGRGSGTPWGYYPMFSTPAILMSVGQPMDASTE